MIKIPCFSCRFFFFCPLKDLYLLGRVEGIILPARDAGMPCDAVRVAETTVTGGAGDDWGRVAGFVDLTAGAPRSRTPDKVAVLLHHIDGGALAVSGKISRVGVVLDIFKAQQLMTDAGDCGGAAVGNLGGQVLSKAVLARVVGWVGASRCDWPCGECGRWMSIQAYVARLNCRC